MNRNFAIGLLCFALLGTLLLGCASYGGPYPLQHCNPGAMPSEAVCGTDGHTYASACFAEEAGVQAAYNGTCMLPK